MYCDYESILKTIVDEIQPFAKEGEQASYIPELKNVDPDKFGICIRTIGGDEFSLGDSMERFSIQSISKVFSLAMALGLTGDALWKRVGVEPSGNAFNSIFLLEMEKGVPRNPLINAGAIVVSDVLLSLLKDPEKEYLDFLRALSGSDDVCFDDSIAASEQSCGYLNAAIANMLKYYGNMENDVESVLHFYFRLCSVKMNCHELARAFKPFADHNSRFRFSNVQLSSSQVKRLNAVMQTCGFYDEAGEFSYKVGLPGKSGVGGGIAAVCPGIYSAAVWSPRLNAKGNSVMGMKALELLTTKTSVSIF